jgi:hypothetical protein
LRRSIPEKQGFNVPDLQQRFGMAKRIGRLAQNAGGFPLFAG